MPLKALLVISAATCLSAAAPERHAAQAAWPTGTPVSWVQAAAKTEDAVLRQQGEFSMQYRERKIDAKGDTTREIIEAKEGGVARLLERNGRPITAAEDADERARLEDALAHPNEFARHHRRDDAIRSDTLDLVKLMPEAMIYTYTPGQPQLGAGTPQQVVLDFEPDPKFRPPTMLSDLLTGLAGRIWINAKDLHMTRVDGRVLHPVNLGYGIVARFYPGGTITFEQRPLGDGHWMYAHMHEQLTVRAFLVRTMPEDVQMTSSDVVPLSRLIGYQEAIRRLLAMRVTLR